MITVGVYIHWAGIGGAEDMVIDQIKYSNKNDFNFLVVTEGQGIGWDDTRGELLASPNVKIYKTDGSLSSYRDIFAAHGVDIVHVLSCGDIQNGYRAALDMGLPVVDVQACVSYSAGYEQCGLNRVQPVYLCKKHWEHGGGGKHEFRIITGGVDVKNLLDYSASEKDDKEYWGLDPSRPVVGWFGRFDQFKCPLSFPTIAKMISQKMPECQFIMFGDGVDRERAIYLARELSVDIKFPGYTRQKASAFNCMDVFLFPTWQEAFGRVMPEAMTLGVPIVTSDYPVCREICNQSAAYMPNSRQDPLPNDVCSDYADSAVIILNNEDLASQMSAAGIHRASSLYNAVTMSSEYERLYLEILTKRS